MRTVSRKGQGAPRSPGAGPRGEGAGLVSALGPQGHDQRAPRGGEASGPLPRRQPLC